MNRGLYSAVSGGLLESRRLQIVANNLANINTVGYKAERLVSREQEFSDTLASVVSNQAPRAKDDHERIPGVTDIDSVTDFSPGPVSNTGNALNVALNKANQFFVVQTPNGERYTRAGNFTMDVNGNLTTMDGVPVLGEGGPIVINGPQPYITSNGTVRAGGEEAGKLRVVEINDVKALEREEGVRFTIKGGAAATPIPAELVPQSVELPNVSVMEAMVDMIAAQRSFEGYTKTVQTMQELNEVSLRNARGTA